MAGLEHPRLAHGEVALPIAKQRPVVAEEGSVEVGVEASKRHGRAPYLVQGGDLLTLVTVTRWRLADRVLEFPPPLAAGIVNITDDSFFEGARSVTPERAVDDGAKLVAAGFDLLDVGAVPARAGKPVAPADEAASLVPAIEGLARQVDVPISADTFSAEVAERALHAGAVAIND